MNAKFSVNYRQKIGKGANRKLRLPKEGLPQNPGIVYGINEPVKVSMRSDEALRFIKQTLSSKQKQFDLEIIKEDKAPIVKTVIIQDYQLNPIGNKLLHVDFREIATSSVIDVDVPIVTIGTSNAIKSGGILQLLRRSVLIRGRVDAIPNNIEIDISNLDFGQSIHAQDIKLPAGSLLVLSKEENYTVATVSAAVEEKDTEANITEIEEKVTPAKGEPAADSKKTTGKTSKN